MQTQSDTKVCPACAETIKAAAKLCPHCRTVLKIWCWQNPSIGALPAVCMFLLPMIFFALWMESLFGAKEPIADHLHEISILNSQFSHRASGSNVLITVIGMVTNRGDFAWQNVAVEAQFFDSQGALIDVIPAVGRGKLLPRGGSAFRIDGNRTKPEGQYVTHKTFVRWGNEGSTWF